LIFALFSEWRSVLGDAVRAAAKSASRTARRGEVVLQTYRGYGSRSRIFLMGRVFREPLGDEPDGQSVWSNLKILWRLTRRWGVPNATLTARLGAVEQQVTTDRDGYFEVDLSLPDAAADGLWRRVAIRLDEPASIDAEGDVFVPDDACRFVVVSDIDDTVMHTGVANKLMMMWRLFVQGADSRTAFPGMAAFLRALHQGPDGTLANPMLYVSRAPWAIYGVLARFFNLHEIPAGPVLFLREWGLTLQNPLPRRGGGHKLNLIKKMLAVYDDLPFILIGDSGQRDPEIYAEIVRRFPNRVQVIYIRDVSADPKRDEAIQRLGADLAKTGADLVFAADTLVMARHAAERGLIAKKALGEVGQEKAAAP
jgi:phosphatidate phosphatase APP1